ncbi:hypothetical protein SAMN04487989_106123 [Bizionia echini]|uniref:Lipoprotein n=1 Tax=Bizionia echini TaxID=649333 RepID=A0A1I5CZU5_9FLAO|nr:DUF6252 family protein [Bizionia echini]SFN92520.1 hypothetical protein SAMN04487989_106123 [Bizionia echini]
MRTLKQFTVFVMMASLVSITACKSDDDGGDPAASGGASGVITAKIDGNSFQSLEITSTASQVTAGPNTTVTLQGNSSTQGFSIIINAFDGVGTYEITDSNVFIVASYIEPNVSNPSATQTWNAPYQDSGVVGEIKVSEDSDTNIKGTFSFQCKNANDDSVKNITEGTFNLTKQIF